VEQIPVLIGI